MHVFVHFDAINIFLSVIMCNKSVLIIINISTLIKFRRL